MIFGIIAAVTAVVVAVVVGVVALVSALSESKKDADENFSKKPCGGKEQKCPLADILVTVVREDKTGDPNFENQIFLKGPSSRNGKENCDKEKDFRGLQPGEYEVSAKPKEGEGYCFENPKKVTVAAGEEKKVKLTLTALEIVEVTPTKEIKQYVNLDASDKDNTLGRVHKFTAKINKKKKDIPIYFSFEPGKKNRANLHADLQAKIEKSAKTDEEGVAKAEFTLGRYGGDTFKILASLSSNLKHESATVKKSSLITVWRRLWYQLNHHKDVTPPSMATAKSKIKHVFIDFVSESPIKHTKAPKGKVLVGSHNAATYHALRKSKHPNRSVHIILCDQQIDGNPGLTNEVEVEFAKNTDHVLATKGGTYIMFNPPLQTGAKLFISGSWNNPKTGKSGTLTDDATKKTANIGVMSFHNKDFVKVELPANAGPTATDKVKVKVKVTVSSGPWGGDGGTAPHNLVVIDSNDTIHTMCVLHELGHLMNMGPMAYSVKCPPGFKYTDHTKMYKSNGAHCYSGGTLVGGKGKNGTCIMYHQLNKKCKLKFCDLCEPFVRAQKLEKFKDLDK